MAYLRLQDYYNFRIQKDQLIQITQGKDIVRTSCELESQSELISYLIQKYDTEEEFRDTKTYSYGGTYLANNLFELNADAYSPTSTYALHSLTLHDGSVYINTTAITVGESFNPSKWRLIGLQYELYYIDTPAKPYSYKITYYEGDLVYYKNMIYKCRVSNTNIIPNDVNKGAYYWYAGVSYSVSGVEPYNVSTDYSAYNSSTTYSQGQLVTLGGVIYQSTQNNNTGQLVTDINYWLPIKWVKGDNRSQQLVAFMVDCVLYKIHMRIAPNNIPQLRVNNYDYVIDWLKQAGGQNNAITADIPLLQPKQGGRIRWGSNTRNINNY